MMELNKLEQVRENPLMLDECVLCPNCYKSHKANLDAMASLQARREANAKSRFKDIAKSAGLQPALQSLSEEWRKDASFQEWLNRWVTWFKSQQSTADKGRGKHH